MKILIVQNCEGLGLYEKYLAEKQIGCDVFHAYQGGRFPSLNRYDAVVVGGTPVSVNEIHEHTFLVRESLVLRCTIQTGKPCLGICFGGQLLASLLGAVVVRNPVMEIGVYEISLTSSGGRHPMFRHFPNRFEVFHWHGDTFDIPEWGERLAEDDDCRNQAFGFRNVVGLQFHLEVTSEQATRWAGLYKHELTKMGKTAASVIDACRASEGEMEKQAIGLMDNFIAWAASFRTDATPQAWPQTLRRKEPE